MYFKNQRFYGLKTFIFVMTCLISCFTSLVSHPVRAQSTPAGEITGETTGACETPNVLILLDRSGSMLDDDKWGQAKQAIEQGVIPFLDRLRFGLIAFPWGTGCGVPDESLRVPIGEATVENLTNVFVEALPIDEALTPLADAINRGKIVLDDLNDTNRRGVLVLLTDGVETCSNPDNPSVAPIEATQAAADAGYLIYTIGFGSLVSRRTLRQMAEIGGTERERSATDIQELTEALTDIIEGVTREQCDLLDNDCDGNIDENVEVVPCEGECGLGERRCVEGQLSECIPNNAPPENCDGTDNDCDGYIDENRTFVCDQPTGERGHQSCDEMMMSMPSPDDCQPLPTPGNPNDPNDPNGPNDPNSIPEGCDGIDNDGDGLVDEGTSQECSRECHRGRRLCVEGDLIGCTAPPVQDERCNGYDDDCDGLVDEMNPCPGAERCGDEGICHPLCEPDGSCAEGFVCGGDGYCESAPCDPGCDQGFLCVAGRCVYPCSVNNDCPSNFRCERRRCIEGDGSSTVEESLNPSPTNGGMNTQPPVPTAGFEAPSAGTGYVPPANPPVANDMKQTADDGCAQGQSHRATWMIIFLMIAFYVRKKTFA